MGFGSCGKGPVWGSLRWQSRKKSLRRLQTWEGWGGFLLVPTLSQTQVAEDVSTYHETKGAGAGFRDVLPFMSSQREGQLEASPEKRQVDPWSGPHTD